MRVLLGVLLMISSVARADELDSRRSCVTGAGDLNRDGAPDLWIASRDDGREVVWAVSGSDGALLHVLSAACRYDGFGAELAVIGDLDDDGVDELAVASRGLHCASERFSHLACSPIASVFSGRTGCLLLELEDGWSVAAAGDFDRDGVPDVLLGCPDFSCHAQLGRATVRSGRDGTLLQRVINTLCPERSGENQTLDGGGLGAFGQSVASVGDVDDDGVPDFAVGAPGFVDAGRVYVLSGRRGALLGGTQGCPPWSSGVGWDLCRAHDSDGDGRDELLITGIHRAVLAVSPREMLPLFEVGTLVRHALDAFGSSLDRTGDIDGDGIDDWLVGANECQNGFFDFGYADVRSGRDGHWIRNLFSSSQHGVDVASAGDVNGDGMDDHVIVMPTMNLARILSGRDGSLVREIDLATLRARSNDPDVLRTR